MTLHTVNFFEKCSKTIDKLHKKWHNNIIGETLMIYRTSKVNGAFTMVDNATVRDKRLSLQAKGLLWFMLSCKDDWTFTSEKSQKETNTKRNRI